MGLSIQLFVPMFTCVLQARTWFLQMRCLNRAPPPRRPLYPNAVNLVHRHPSDANERVLALGPALDPAQPPK